jgi:hypothetical protein
VARINPVAVALGGNRLAKGFAGAIRSRVRCALQRTEAMQIEGASKNATYLPNLLASPSEGPGGGASQSRFVVTVLVGVAGTENRA